MALNIKRGPQARAIRFVLYGPEGIGKSTLASQFPDPVFIDFEHGTDTMNVARFDTPKSYESFMTLINSIALEDVCKSVIIDTADKLEQMLIEHVCRVKNFQSIEDAGYGKGYTYLADVWIEVLKALDKIIESGKNIVIVAHATMRKFEQPDEMGAYDRWELKLQKKSAPLIKEWADVLLFLNYKSTVVTDEKTKSQKAVGGKRVMYANHAPTYDAKNRFGLPDVMPMEYEQIAHIFKDVPVKVSPLVTIREAIANAKITEDSLMTYLITQCNATEDELENLSMNYIQFTAQNINKIIQRMKKQEEHKNE